MQRFGTQCAGVLTMAVAVAFVATGFSHAQQSASEEKSAPPSGDALYETLQSMQEEMQRLRKDNESMKGQIDDLRAKTDADWLTEARANEIRGLVQETLADADTRASLLQNGIMAGWSEHFFLADAFGRFMLQIEGMTQIRFIYNYRDQPDRSRFGFENHRTRLGFRGHIFNEDLQFLIRTESTPYPPANIAPGAFYLLDAWVRYNLDDNWSVRAGQFKLPFNREELVSTTQQLAVDRTLVNENYAVGRSQGVELAYHDSANAWAIAFSNGSSFRGIMTQVGVQPALGTNTSAIGENVEHAITSRYERLLAGTWSQFSDFTSPVDEEYGALLGIAVHIQHPESTSTPFVGADNETQLYSVTADYSVEWGGANAFAAVIYHYVDSPSLQILHFLGVVGQAGIYLTPKWEAFARAEWGQLEGAGGATAALPDFSTLTLGFNYYVEGHDIKWTTDVTFALTEISSFLDSERVGIRDINEHGLSEVVFRTQVQILF